MADNVRVAVRVRPFNAREKERLATNIISMRGGKTTCIANPDDKKAAPREFTFDYSYNSHVARDDPEYASQDTVWRDIGVGVLENAYAGYNCSLFAYGQTGSGKSYSMMGYGEDKGIIPIMCERIFDRVRANTDPDVTIRVEASMLEIYMEKVKDLFNPKAGELKVRLNPAKGFYVDNLTRNAVADFATISKLMDAGTKARTVASTAMNATSSRAHTIFQLMLTQTKVDREAGKATDKSSLINLIDLAGSERADSTGATGERLKEGSAINQSLSSLGNVISALAANSDPDKKQQRVPFRDSVLTMLLENSLGGNSKTIMIAAVSPADINYDETLGTLRYADRAKQIKNKAVVNEDPNEKMIRGLKDEIDALRKALASGGGGQGLTGEALEAEKERIKEELRRAMRDEIEGEKGWEQKLKETQERSEARERELRDMGVMSGAEREAQLARAKSEPHLMNLNEDPQLDRQIMFFLAAGRETSVGRKDADSAKDIKLAGLSILKDHAVLRRAASAANGGDGDVSIEPAAGAKVYVNGERISRPTPLHHGSRIVFGTSHVYMLELPAAAAAGAALDGVALGETADYSFAMEEMNKSQKVAMQAEEAKRRAELEEEKLRMAELEARMRKEREAAEKEAQDKIAAYEARAKEYAGNEERLTQLRAEQEKQAAAALARQHELEERLKAQRDEMEQLQRKKHKDNQRLSLLDEKVRKTSPYVNEANAMAEELGRHVLFAPKLMMVVGGAKKGAEGGAGDASESKGADLDADLFIIVDFPGGAPQAPARWTHAKFMDRLYAMKEIYQAWLENGRSLAGTDFAKAGAGADPFHDEPEPMLVGVSTFFLAPLQYLLPSDDKTAILNYAGKEMGELQVRIVPHASAEPPKAAVEASTAAEGSGGGDDGAGDGDSDLPESIEELKGKKLFISVFVDGIRGLDPSVSHGSFVKFRTFMGDEPRRTPDVFKKINPRFAYHTTFANAVTADFIKYIATAPLEMEVWGLPAPAAPAQALLAPVAAPAAHAAEHAKAAPHHPSALEASPTPAPTAPAVAAAAATTEAAHEPLIAAPAHGEAAPAHGAAAPAHGAAAAAAAAPTTESSASAAAAPPAAHALGSKTSATVAPEPAPAAAALVAAAPAAAAPAAASTAKPPEPAAAKGCCAVA